MLTHKNYCCDSDTYLEIYVYKQEKFGHCFVLSKVINHSAANTDRFHHQCINNQMQAWKINPVLRLQVCLVIQFQLVFIFLLFFSPTNVKINATDYWK